MSVRTHVAESLAQEMRGEFDRTFAEPPRAEIAAVENLLAIRVGDHPYAIRIAEIKGILADRAIVLLPTLFPALIGLAGHRSSLIPVYDLSTLLGHARTSDPRWIVLVAAFDALAGLAFDRFEGQLQISASALATAGYSEASRRRVSQLVRVGDITRPLLSISSLLEEIPRPRASALPKEP